MTYMPIVQRAKNTKQGKKARKYGRKGIKSPAQQRYTSERRWETNKERKAQKLANKFGHSVKIKIQEEWVVIKKNK